MIPYSSILVFVVGIALSGGFFFFVNDYMKLKTAYKISQSTITLLEHRNKVLDKLLTSVEEAQTKNYQKQREYFQQFNDKGFIITDDGLNPQWMHSEA